MIVESRMLTTLKPNHTWGFIATMYSIVLLLRVNGQVVQFVLWYLDYGCSEPQDRETRSLALELCYSNSESAVNDSDSEEVENVFVEDNGKPIDGLVDDARKKVEVPPRGLPGKLDIEEVEHENAYGKKS
ncbi:hypothetical protein Tco_0901048 [Tanacetum coccineum]